MNVLRETEGRMRKRYTVPAAPHRRVSAEPQHPEG